MLAGDNSVVAGYSNVMSLHIPKLYLYFSKPYTITLNKTRENTVSLQHKYSSFQDSWKCTVYKRDTGACEPLLLSLAVGSTSSQGTVRLHSLMQICVRLDRIQFSLDSVLIR